MKRIILLFLMSLFSACSNQWYLIKEVTIKPKDINTIARVIDTTRPEIENIRAIQNATSYQDRKSVV